MLDHFHQKGWVEFDQDPELTDWLHYAAPQAESMAADDTHRATWMRHQDTWFVGADVLGNDAQGAVAGSGPLRGQAAAFCNQLMGGITDWGPGQVSVCYEGYPKQDEDESDANHRYRINRDAAHLDGLKPVGPNRRRFLQEYHQFILGIPTTDNPSEAAPFVIWEGSHLIFQDMLEGAFGNTPPEDWDKIDLTEIYQSTRKQIFETCPRHVIHAKPGQAYLAHRLSLHGVAPWGGASKRPRSILYFRPFWQGDRTGWLKD